MREHLMRFLCGNERSIPWMGAGSPEASMTNVRSL